MSDGELTPTGPPPPPPAPPAPQPTNGMAVASLVLGILSILLFFTVVPPFILGGLGVIFGIIGLTKAGQGAPNKGLAIAGLVCGAIGLDDETVIATAAAKADRLCGVPQHPLQLHDQSRGLAATAHPPHPLCRYIPRCDPWPFDVCSPPASRCSRGPSC